jgi:serine/threonine protein kinase/tetratricopeptide (TPR) repeat protein
MNAEFRRIKEIFLAAVEKPEPAERDAYLREACGQDEELRRQVDALLGKHAQAGSFLESPAPSPVPTVDEPPVGESPGSVIGPYKLVEQIGEGGMGTVWMAQQTEPVRRLVALKLIKAGMDSRQVIARFEAERQALALMDHANIARVLDAGTTDAGRPYFVMDLVKGVPITRYCDEHRLTLRQRLELFVPVCQAVQHAHQKGVIHRDLKPSNVLVALYDSQPVPKIIDFGVAKAAGPPLTEKTLVTGFGALVGTLEYMSPEQAEINQLDIDTRSDIYSLGVLLYELLTGSPPFSHKEQENAGVLEMLRVIREQEPSKPSAKLSTAEGLPTLAANRGMEPAKLTKLVRGELDWIVMKALEKDRNRRYETANGFAMDVQRYLADEPVLACPPSTVYRLKKLVRRNRGVVLAAGLIFLALVVGVIGTSLGLIRAERARKDADQAWFRETQRAEEAQMRLVQVERGAEIMASVFQDVSPKTEATEKVTLRVLLGRRLAEAAKQLEGEAVGDPLIVARLQHLLGISLRELGHPGPAEALLVKARDTRERLLRSDHLDTVSTKHNLAGVYQDLARYDLAEQLLKEVIEVRSAQLGPDHTETLSSKNNLALVYMRKRRLDLAEPLLREVLAIRTEKLGPDAPKSLQSMHNLIGLYGEQGKWEEAEPLLEKVVKKRMVKPGPKHPDTILSRTNLATLYSRRGKYAESEALFKQVLGIASAELGPGHGLTLIAKNNLSELYENQGLYPLAEVLLKEVINAQRDGGLPADHPDVLREKRNLGLLYWKMKRNNESIPLMEETLKYQRIKLRANDSRLLETRAHLGRVYQDEGRFADAILLFEEVRRQGAPPTVAWVGRWLLTAYVQAGKKAEAALLAAALQREARQKFPADSAALGAALTEVGQGFLSGKAYADADPLLREGYSLGERKAPDSWATHLARAELGGALLGQKKYSDAEPHLVGGYSGMKKFENDPGRKESRRTDQVYRTEALERLVQLYDATKKPDVAAKWRNELERTKEKP